MGLKKSNVACCDFHKDGIVVYVDGVDWQHEIGEALGGNKVYPDLEDLKENNPCWDSCGVVRCRLVIEDWVEPQDLWKGGVSGVEIEAERKTKGEKRLRLEHLNGIKEYHEKQVRLLNERIKKTEQE